MHWKFSMPIIAVLALIICLPVTTPALSGASSSSVYVVPVAASNDGLHGTFWQTDATFTNPYDSRSITVVVAFLASNQANVFPASTSYTIAAGGELVVADIVASAFDAAGTGSLWAYTLDGAHFWMTSRTYTSSDLGSWGQTEPAQDFANDCSGRVIIPGVEIGDAMRTNVGATNLDSKDAHLAVSVRDSAGAEVDTFSIDLPAFSHGQISVSTETLSGGYLVIGCSEVGPGGAWISYISVVDNGSGDAVFIEDRNDIAGTRFHPTADMTGWWSATLLDAGAFVAIAQDGAQVSAGLYDEEGSPMASLEGYEHEGTAWLHGPGASAFCLGEWWTAQIDVATGELAWTVDGPCTDAQGSTALGQARSGFELPAFASPATGLVRIPRPQL